jgi:tetratricopeptide (TPR) repeat protein
MMGSAAGWRNAAIVVCGLLSCTSGFRLQAEERAGSPAAATALRLKGLEAGYNLDHAAAIEAFRASITADPDHPAAHRLLAACYWVQQLWRQGTVTVDDYFGRVDGDLPRGPADPQLAAAFRLNVNNALALAEKRLRQNPSDADAHYQLGAVYGLLTSYETTVEGKVAGGIRTARRAYLEQKRALKLDAGRRDAGLQLGLYRYSVSTLAAPLRLLASLVGMSGGKEQGVRLVEQAAAVDGEAQANAQFTLVAIYNREGRFDEALRTIEELQRKYPRNRLLWFEAASTALRAGRPGQAMTFADEGLKKLAADTRPRALNEEARWQTLRASIVSAGKRGPS